MLEFFFLSFFLSMLEFQEDHLIAEQKIGLPSLPQAKSSPPGGGERWGMER